MLGDGSVKNGCISSRIVTFQIPPFSTSMIMGERMEKEEMGFIRESKMCQQKVRARKYNDLV